MDILQVIIQHLPPEIRADIYGQTGISGLNKGSSPEALIPGVCGDTNFTPAADDRNPLGRACTK